MKKDNRNAMETQLKYDGNTLKYSRNTIEILNKAALRIGGQNPEGTPLGAIKNLKLKI